MNSFPIHVNILFCIAVLDQRADTISVIGSDQRQTGSERNSGPDAGNSLEKHPASRQNGRYFLKTTKRKSLMNAISGLPKKNSAEKLRTPKITTIRIRKKTMVPAIFDIC
jgi:hypothetical protein